MERKDAILKLVDSLLAGNPNSFQRACLKKLRVRIEDSTIVDKDAFKIGTRIEIEPATTTIRQQYKMAALSGYGHQYKDLEYYATSAGEIADYMILEDKNYAESINK